MYYVLSKTFEQIVTSQNWNRFPKVLMSKLGTLLIRGGQLDWVAVVRRQPPARRLLRLLVHLLLLHGLRAAG